MYKIHKVKETIINFEILVNQQLIKAKPNIIVVSLEVLCGTNNISINMQIK